MPVQIFSTHSPGSPHRPLALSMIAPTIAAIALTTTGCGEAGTGNDTAADLGAAAANGEEHGTLASEKPRITANGPAPGPDAAPGCEVLADPVYRLANNENPAAVAAEVRRLAAGVDDNALSAVASRMSGLAMQPRLPSDAMQAQWMQFRQLCDMG